MKCRLCSSEIRNSFSEAKILSHSVKYYECSICDYVQTERPYWLEEAYASPISPSDTGIMNRNLSNVGLVLASLALINELKGTVVDYAGGHGFLVRLLRDQGINAFWTDPYSENLVARGFEYSGGMASLVTAFEAFEHFVNPMDDMKRLVEISPNILITTTFAPSPTPYPSDWWYYGLDHGQHIGFYRMKTLEYMAKKFNLRLLSDRHSTHFFVKQKFIPGYWQVVRRLQQLFPYIFTVGLKPKTWDDHLSVIKI